jgi:hypothetical protein
MHRRALLATLGSSLLGVAGCLSDDGSGGPTATPTDPSPTQTTHERTRTTDRQTQTTRETPSTGTPTDDAYVVPGAKHILGPAGADVRNATDEAATVTVAVEYEGDRFYERTFDVAAGAEAASEPIVASHATYDVVVETADGRRATYEWSIPENWHWPRLTVLVADDGSVRVGCAWPSEQSVGVENADGSERDLTLTLSDDDGAVVETTETVPAGEGKVSVAVPIGGEYDLRVETADGADTASYVVCYCRTTRATVEIRDGVPDIDTVLPVCE